MRIEVQMNEKDFALKIVKVENGFIVCGDVDNYGRPLQNLKTFVFPSIDKLNEWISSYFCNGESND